MEALKNLVNEMSSQMSVISINGNELRESIKEDQKLQARGGKTAQSNDEKFENQKGETDNETAAQKVARLTKEREAACEKEIKEITSRIVKKHFLSWKKEIIKAGYVSESRAKMVENVTKDFTLQFSQNRESSVNDTLENRYMQTEIAAPYESFKKITLVFNCGLRFVKSKIAANKEANKAVKSEIEETKKQIEIITSLSFKLMMAGNINEALAKGAEVKELEEKINTLENSLNDI